MNKEVTICISAIVAIMLIVISGVIGMEKRMEEIKAGIYDLGYDVKEVEVFCSRIGATLEDFLVSQGLQRQYLKFINGETTDFIRKSEYEQESNRSSSSNFATGIAVGASLSTAK